MDNKQIFVGMPTFLGESSQEQFSSNWPQSKDLPPLVNKSGFSPLPVENFDLADMIQQLGETICSKIRSKSTNTFELRKVMKITKCPHKDKKHYAKNMCSDCYHKKAKEKKVTVCGHPERNVFARNMCLSCYTSAYRKSKK